MRRTPRRLIAPAAATMLALFGLAACGNDNTDEPEATEEVTVEDVAEEEAEEPEPTQEAEDAEEDEADAAGEGGEASWATPVTTDGDSLGAVEVGEVVVEVYQVAQDQSGRDSIWADPDTDEPIVKEGDDVIVLNYVVTNNGDPITLSYGLVDVRFAYDSWPYMQQPSVADTSLMESHGVNDNGVNSDSTGEDAYVLGTGEQYSVGEVMLYQPGEDFTVSVELVERDDQGESTGEREESELTGTVE